MDGPEGTRRLRLCPEGDLSSAPSCGEKQYSSGFIDIPLIKEAANQAADSNPSLLRPGNGKRTQSKAHRFDPTRKLYKRHRGLSAVLPSSLILETNTYSKLLLYSVKP